MAGVYPIYLHSTAALDFVLFIGAFTALFAGTIGMVVNDLKRILAYSTIRNRRSPTLVTMKAFFAAEDAFGLKYQKPINR